MVALRRRIFNLNGLVSGVLISFFAGALTVSLVAYSKGAPANLWPWADGFAQKFGTLLTFLLLEVLVGGRQARFTFALAPT